MKGYILLLVCFFLGIVNTAGQKSVYPGADENTPSKAQYFSWINNTNEGATAEQTKINLAFFEWLKQEYGMQLDIYALDAGAIDGKRFYGSIYSDRFKKQFPNGFEPIYKQAKSMGVRLGVWGGADGFGNTPEEEQARIDEMVKLCRDYDFALFKFDAVCGPLRPEKEDAFIKMMEKCRKYSPDLILLNHRLGLDKGKPYATTFLWEGYETYIDVFMTNNSTAPHHRAGALSRGLPPELKRLTEDHGVCLSSCLDFWEDDLVLQAFNRSLILSPELYGNPWLLRDDEFSQLARFFNLHKKYGDILVNAKTLPKSYGPHAVARGDEETRFITLRNLGWNDTSYVVNLNNELGLSAGEKVTLLQLHPSEKVLGAFNFGEKVEVTVDPFRACMLLATTAQPDEPLVNGVDYKVIRDIEGEPVEIKLLGMPGEKARIRLPQNHKYSKVLLNGRSDTRLVKGKTVKVNFEGKELKKDPHRKLAEMKPVSKTGSEEAFYEATVFAADNNALEVRSLKRSGKTDIPAVKAARNAFFNQETFVERGIWDKNLFDGDMTTGFWPSEKYKIDQRVKGGGFRLDLGKVMYLDELIIHVPDDFSLQPLLRGEGNYVEVSSDLQEWKQLTYIAGQEMKIRLEEPVRYFRFKDFPQRIVEIEGLKNGVKVNNDSWRASNLFAHPDNMEVQRVWSASFELDEIAPNSYMCVALKGKHGVEGAYAAARIGGELVGAPDRAVSYPSNTWEYVNARRDENYTYYIPVDQEDVGKKIEVFVMGYDKENLQFSPEVWISSYPVPSKSLKLELIK
ncbi:hypothetical protein [Marinilabilia rubra]|uniref:Uncharacterized protein n=1 Tax=Marinilabilia rubra TaxID=2162893 RepID=A0A2U2B5V8_9BACT|nr:hypothetical protein [Marinilabilia rubra]PWD98461.1 hypothetical protein DDZ16_15385 [Marinilabilia rubra]